MAIRQQIPSLIIKIERFSSFLGSERVVRNPLLYELKWLMTTIWPKHLWKVIIWPLAICIRLARYCNGPNRCRNYSLCQTEDGKQISWIHIRDFTIEIRMDIGDTVLPKCKRARGSK